MCECPRRSAEVEEVSFGPYLETSFGPAAAAVMLTPGIMNVSAFFEKRLIEAMVVVVVVTWLRVMMLMAMMVVLMLMVR